jgi:hypothetical protein
MQGSAVFSKDKQYRYALRRTWDPSLPTVLFIGLNPSTADHRINDRTVARCIRFAQDWGFGQLIVANLFAFRTPYPRTLWRARDPIGPRNDRWLRRLIAESDTTVAAWGTHGARFERDRAVLPLLRQPKCLAVSKGGHPKHPLYIRATTRLRELPRIAVPEHISKHA